MRQPSTVCLRIRLPLGIAEKLDRLALESGDLSRSATARQILADALETPIPIQQRRRKKKLSQSEETRRAA